MTQRSKKSETFQVCLPHGLKQGFMQQCETEDRLASDVIRDYIQGYVTEPVRDLVSPHGAAVRRRLLYPTLATAAASLFALLSYRRPARRGLLAPTSTRLTLTEAATLRPGS